MGHCLVIPKLCNVEVEDPEHFVSLCPALLACRDDLLALATPQVRVRQSLPNPTTHPSEFCDVILGTSWIDLDTEVLYRISLCSQGRKSHLINPYPLKASVLIGQLSQRGGKKERRRLIICHARLTIDHTYTVLFLDSASLVPRPHL